MSREEHISGDSSSPKNEEITEADQNEKEMTLGDALTQVKDTTLASVEELHTLVGGADIKVKLSPLRDWIRDVFIKKEMLKGLKEVINSLEERDSILFLYFIFLRISVISSLCLLDK